MADLFSAAYQRHFFAGPTTQDCARAASTLASAQARYDAAAPDEIPEEVEALLIAIDDARHALRRAESSLKDALKQRAAEDYDAALNDARGHITEAREWLEVAP